MKLGTDIIHIQRIERSMERFGEAFKNKFLNASEAKRAQNTQSIAGLWAAKEAISKALGCGIGSELSFHDITICKNEKGSPYFQLSDQAQATHQIESSSLSISHDGGFAIAVVVIHTKTD